MSYITKQKQYDKIFQNLEKITNLIPAPVYWIDLEGIVIGANDETFKRLGGLEIREKIVGKGHYDFYPKEVADALMENNNKVIKLGKSMEFEEKVVDIATGETKYAIAIRSPLRDDEGVMIGIIGASIEITAEKKLQQERVQEAVNKAKSEFIDNFPTPVYWNDLNSVVLGVNQKVIQAAGANSFDDFVGKKIHDLRPKALADRIVSHNKRVIETGMPLSQEEEIKDLKTGESKYFNAFKAPLRDADGRIVGTIGTSIDITAEKKLQQAQEAASQAKSEFIANMSHDIRAPLTEIVGFAEIIKKETNDLRVKEYADNLIAASHMPLKFFNGILGAIKVLTGDIPTVKRKFQLVDITNKIIQLVKPKALEKKLNIELNFDEKIPQYVIGDPTRIQCILLELISNALNFTEKGDITVDIKLARKQARELVIKCAVKDTGIGIPIDKQEDIFLRFKRLMPSYKGIYAGAGLGLTVVKQFIDDLMGEIYCQSEEGVGSNFICLIPMQEALLDDDTGATDLVYG